MSYLHSAFQIHNTFLTNNSNNASNDIVGLFVILLWLFVWIEYEGWSKFCYRCMGASCELRMREAINTYEMSCSWCECSFFKSIKHCFWHLMDFSMMMWCATESRWNVPNVDQSLWACLVVINVQSTMYLVKTKHLCKKCWHFIKHSKPTKLYILRHEDK